MAETRAQKFSRIIVTVPREIAEPFGSALIELGAGAVQERPTRNADTVEIVLSLPSWEALEPWQDLMRSLYQAFTEELALPTDVFTMRSEQREVDYHKGWLDHLTLVRLTETIVLCPTFDVTETPAGCDRLLFSPHPSFGDGTHPTTRLMAEAVERYARKHPGIVMLDVGTGNGVLCLVAALRGGQALGIDIDDGAVQSAQKNAQLNQLSSQCQFATTKLECIEEQFSLVVANLEPLTQLELVDAIAYRVARGETLYLSGFLAEQTAMVRAAYEQLGFRFLSEAVDGDYARLELCAPDEPPGETQA